MTTSITVNVNFLENIMLFNRVKPELAAETPLFYNETAFSLAKAFFFQYHF